MNPLAVVVLAAGAGTRMKSDTPKTLHAIGGRTLLAHSLYAAAALQPTHLVVVVGHQREKVEQGVNQWAAESGMTPIIAVQEQQNGTGHAVACAMAAPELAGFEGTVVVTNADVPLLAGETLKDLVATHRGHNPVQGAGQTGAAAAQGTGQTDEPTPHATGTAADSAAVTVLTVRQENPFGYGRILRAAHLDGALASTDPSALGAVPTVPAAGAGAAAVPGGAASSTAAAAPAAIASAAAAYGTHPAALGDVVAIVEEKDATDAQRLITEVNSGVFAFDAAVLRDALGRLDTNNAQGELYLTDVVSIAHGDGRTVRGHLAADAAQLAGVNDRVQLAAAGRELNRRICEQWMRNGATIIDPATTWIDVTATVGRDVTIYPGTQLLGTTSIADGAHVGPDTTLTNVQVGEGAHVVRSHGFDSQIGPGADIGPFAYLRPGTVLAAETKIGTYVETKNVTIGRGTKVPHLTYVGDATIGEFSNIGCSSVFANYDGVNKHHTRIGSHVRTGSDTTFVAPVVVGDGAYSGAGTVITQDVPAGALVVPGARQRVIEGWVATKRPGTAADRAARHAQESGVPIVEPNEIPADK